jgi:serine phosphatase RsbU (regulator of sigma subunit)
VNAGHPPPLIYRKATGALEEVDGNDSAGLPVGVLDNYGYNSCHIALSPGDSILIFSDGVTDAMDLHNVPFRSKGVYAALQGGRHSPRTLGECLVKAIKVHAAGRNQHDDITLVTFGRTA